jgi:aldehyde dehydrogenase (NAD+)/phenylacetaldehyde dehydrogenase
VGAALRLGASGDRAGQLGPLVSAAACAWRFVARARDAGIAAVEARGRLPEPGHFLAPTVLRDVPPDAEVARECSARFWPSPRSTIWTRRSRWPTTAPGLAAHVWTRDRPHRAPCRRAAGGRHGLCQLHPGGRSGLSLWRDESSGLGRENGSEVLDAISNPNP